MAAVRAFGRHQMELPVTHAALAHRVVRQRLDRLDRPAQHRDLEAGVMVEMDMQGRHLEIVVAMLRPGEPPADAEALIKTGVARVYTPKDFDLTQIMRDIVAVVDRAWKEAA